ncbi:MAG: SWIM zinc finger family protein [Archaeoglobaceae archaeon]|nr:SWIM zinc finger family protein [Archaeoglobaceae archaeon]MDW7989362.1 SWIM zinc finger family protein [Archaeoglobaceae archaeon]
MKLKNEVVDASNKGIGYDLYRALFLNYGKRGEKAFLYLFQRRVKKYLDFFIVVGRNEYIVEDFFCTCPDFQLNLRSREPCAHIIAVEVAKILKFYDEINTYYADFQKI